jgi:hypothetical protein
VIGSEREYVKLGRVVREEVNTPIESYVAMTDLLGCPTCGVVVFDTKKHWDNGPMTKDQAERLQEAVVDLLWAELDPFLSDGAIHPHTMRAIAARIVALLNAPEEA